MSAPLISVIVPVYNVERYLNKCIDSIVSQTYKNLEIILVDDGSSDNCPAICDEWAEKDSRIKVIHKENGGVSSARNTGIELAAGEYLGFVDSDDYIDSDMYTVLYHQIKLTAADLSVVGVYYGERTDCFDSDITFSKHQTHLMLFNQRDYMAFNGYLVNKLYKSEIIHKNNIRLNNNITMGEDMCFNFEYISHIDKSCVTKYCGYYYEYREDSCTNSMAAKLNYQIIKVTKYFLDNAFDKELYKSVVEWSLRFWLGIINDIVIYNQDVCNAELAVSLIKKNIHLILSSQNVSPVNKIQSLAVFLSKSLYIFLLRKKNKK